MSDRVCRFDKAVLDQQEATEAKINEIRSNMSEQALISTHCRKCGDEIPLKRQQAGRANNISIVYCIACKSFIEGKL